MEKDAVIAVLGDNGLLGSAVCKLLKNKGFFNVVGCHYPDVDLTEKKDVESFFSSFKPDYVFFLAAIAAGIEYKKKHPEEMLVKNLLMTINVLMVAKAFGCKKVLNVSSALIYSDLCDVPYREESIKYVDIGSLDSPYAVAKATGIMLSDYYSREGSTKFLTAIPCNFFGENAPFDVERASVVSSLIRKMHYAKVDNLKHVDVWGTGEARRDFLNSKDVADACLFLMSSESAEGLYNIGRGKEFTIRETANVVKRVVGFTGDLVFDASKPEGKRHMLLDVQRINELGWQPHMSLEESVQDAYDWFLNVYLQKHDLDSF